MKLSICIAAVFLSCSVRAATTRPSVNEDAMNKLGWRLGCQAYTFRAMSLFETIDTLNALGIRYVEMFPGQKLSKDHPNVKADHNMPEEMIDALLAKLKEANVTAVSYGVVGLKDEAEAKKVFDFGKKMGLETIVSEPPADMMDAIEKLTGEYKMNLAIHDHPKPSHYWNPDAVIEVITGRDGRIGACADVGHWYRSDLVPVDCLKKLDGRIVELHFKDIAKDKTDVPWGQGQCDVKGMLAELKRQGFRGVFHIEYETGKGEELIGNVAKSIEYFNGAVTELAQGK